jgi:hypothetical protein
VPVSRCQASVIAFAFILAVCAIPAVAQTQPAPPRPPDLLGIYPGMPMNAARVALQKHSSNYQVQNDAQPELGFSLADLQNRDTVNVYLTKAPNEPTVWLVNRGQNIWTDHPMTVTALVTALREKYGKETVWEDRGGGGLYLYWLYDQNGRLIASANRAVTGCNGGGFELYMRNGLPQVLNEDQKRCYASFYAVTASLNRSPNPEMLQAYNVELVNLPYAYKAAVNTQNAINAAAEKARQDQLKKANKNKPVF